jgi:HD-like signal output (HDOD) protein
LSAIESKGFFIKPPDYIKAITAGEDFFIQFQKLTPEIDALIIKIIHRFLEQYDLLFYKNTVIAITRELINNGIKANLKRLYFEIKGFNINDRYGYRAGMENFKEHVFQNEDNDVIRTIEGSKYVVRVNFSQKNGNLHITIINNNPIIDPELNKIKARINKAYTYTDMSEAFMDVLDDSEGTGLGLIMALMLLKNSGLPRESFSISKTEKLTSITLTLPTNLSTPEMQSRITEEILNEINEIPAIPDNVREIWLLCRDPKSDISDISKAISRDPGLTASIIKLANSAAYVTSERINTIDEAVKIIGLKGINTLLIATGVIKIVESKYKRYEAIWQDSYKRAFYSQIIARIKPSTAKIGDQAYLAALLADIGKIVLLSINPDLSSKIREISGFKGMTDSNLIEEISLGISHSSLAALICKKWNFNEALTSAVKLHHAPHRAPEPLRDLIFTVYLADAFVEIENDKYRFEIINDDVLRHFKLENPADFTAFHNKLKDSYSGRDKTIS